MRPPTSYLPENIRSVIRFTVIGTTGMFIQTGIFMLALWALKNPDKGEVLYYVAFAIGYAVEVIPNYLFLNWYAFGTKPSLKNAGGFAIARVVNLVVQLGLLPLVLMWLPGWRDDLISYVVIFIGGCINYLICRIFFKKKKKE